MIGLQNQKRESSTAEGVQSYAISIIASGVIIALLYFGRAVFITALVAVIIAFLLEPLVSMLTTRARIPRPLATFLVGLVAVLSVYFAAMALFNQLSGIAQAAPQLRNNLASEVGVVTTGFQNMGETVSGLLGTKKPVPPAPPPDSAPPRKGKKTASPDPAANPPGTIQEVRIHEDRNPISDYVVANLGTVYEFILMASFVPFLVYFMLSWRDHIYKSFLRFFEGADRLIVARSVSGISTVARAFVVGNFMIGIILATLSAGLFALIHLPYYYLIGSLSGFLSLTPYIGLPLALLPPLFAALATSSSSTVILFVFIIVVSLHLTAMNVFYPKLVGARVHLNPLVVTFSLMFWGFLWGAAGLILAIPITAGIKAICDNVAALKPYGRFLGD